jgi:hypothetical protein
MVLYIQVFILGRIENNAIYQVARIPSSIPIREPSPILSIPLIANLPISFEKEKLDDRKRRES